MTQTVGRKLALSLPRRYLCDLLALAQTIPAVPLQRRLQLGEVVVARGRAVPCPSWDAIFLKAYALVNAGNPLLRRTYLKFPWPHLHEHPANRAAVTVEREVNGESALVFPLVDHPEKCSLRELDEHLQQFQNAPLDALPGVCWALRRTRLPRPLRRWLWRLTLHLSGSRRAARLGTFGVAPTPGLGALTLQPLSLLTTTLTRGEVEADGSVEVRVIYDHRVLDGGTVARALQELERTLNQEILSELRYYQEVRAA